MQIHLVGQQEPRDVGETRVGGEPRKDLALPVDLEHRPHSAGARLGDRGFVLELLRRRAQALGFVLKHPDFAGVEHVLQHEKPVALI